MPPRFPSSSLAGKRANTWLANGYFGVLTGILGDLDYMCQTLELPRWSRNVNSCALCLCDAQGPFSWKVFKPDAPWVSRCWKPSTWSGWEGKSTCGLFKFAILQQSMSNATICVPSTWEQIWWLLPVCYGLPFLWLVPNHLPKIWLSSKST